MTEALFKKLEGVQACVFDVYGTLFDIASAVMIHASELGEKAPEIAKLWRAKQLEYTWVRSLIGVHADFWHVTREALDFTLETFAITEAGLADEVMTGLLKLDVFADVGPALAALRAKGKRLAILSNGSPSMLDQLLRHAGMDKSFEHVLSVEDVGIFKPSRRVYRLAMQKLHMVDAPSICFISANGWDAHSAAQFGFQAVRLARGGGAGERLPGKLAASVTSLGQVVELV